MKLKIEKSNAQVAYDNADAAGKQLLEDMFPGEFKPVLITDRVKTWADACAIKGIDPITSLPFQSPMDDMQLAVNATFQAYIIFEVLNEGWKPNWNNSGEYKYYPYFDIRNGFSCHAYRYGRSGTFVGSRLCFKSRELAEYAGKTFTDIYKQFFVINK